VKNLISFENPMKLTKNCIHPWRMANIFGDGTILPCCSPVSGNYGNLKKDYLNNASDSDMFKNPDYKVLRKSLLTGELLDGCKTCRFVVLDNIPTQHLRENVVNYLKGAGNLNKDLDLLSDFAIEEVTLSITNKCNLRCVYCPQSAPKKKTKENSTESYNFDKLTASIEFYKAEISHKDFMRSLEYLAGSGLKRLNFVGLSELTIYKNWHDLIINIRNLYPKIQLSVVSNFSLPFEKKDIDALMKFNQISISCDTLDEELFSKIRVGGDLKIVLSNIKLLLEQRDVATNPPTVVINVTEYDLMIKTLPELAKFASKNNISINFSNLYDAPGSVMDKTKAIKRISAVPDNELPFIWEILNALPRQMKAENPKVDIGQIGPFYDDVRQRMFKLNKHLFVPSVDEYFLQAVYNKFKLSDEIYLRNIFLDFETSYRGVYLPIGGKHSVEINASFSGIITPILVKERLDGNILIHQLPSYFGFFETEVCIDASFDGSFYTNVLFCLEQRTEVPEAASKIIDVKGLGMSLSEPTFIRETLLVQDINIRLMKIADRHKEFYIWGNGARTRMLFEWTELKNLNIVNIIDSNLKLNGTFNYEIEVIAPEHIKSFEIPVIVLHATEPYSVELEIRLKNYPFEYIYIL
jgi:MoaA/NifB/PqqE/SkfB family radical SAM enzyme